MEPYANARTPMIWRVGLAGMIVVLTLVAWFLAPTIGPRGQAMFGVVVFIAIAALFSENLRAVDVRTIVTGLGLQVLLAVLILRVEAVYDLFRNIGSGIATFLSFADQGALFVYGPLANAELTGQAFGGRNAFIFVCQAMPAVIFVSSVFTVLYHIGILQLVVRTLAVGVMFVMGKRSVSGAESLSAVANVFMGQTEAPLIVKPYVPRMTRSELLALMIGGMATISGGIMAIYIKLGADQVAILATSVMAAPAGLYLSKLLIPETGIPETRGTSHSAGEKQHSNIIDAASGGASEGMKLVLNIIAMLIAFIAIIAMLNYGLSLINPNWSLEAACAVLFAPVALLMGVIPADVPNVAELLGVKLVINEFVAFITLTTHMQPGMDRAMVDPRSYKLATYALTGFANFASIGIQLGGIGAMAENRRGDLASLGMKALLGGFLATLINAAIAGILME